jgi:hypothetical protein
MRQAEKTRPNGTIKERHMQRLINRKDQNMESKLEREVRHLKAYAIVSTLLFSLLFVLGFRAASEEKTKFGEIDVERINVVEKSGKLDLVISNSERMPPAIVNGKAMKGEGSRSPGMLFYNGKGDESGGMGFGSEAEKGGAFRASSQFMFDQYNQDQAVGILYSDNNGKRTAGLRVWDRADMPLDELYAKFGELRGAEREAAIKKLVEQGMVGAGRVFVGKLPDKSASLVLSDTKGKPRLTVSVDAEGNPKISFLDENGKVTYALPPADNAKQ